MGAAGAGERGALVCGQRPGVIIHSGAGRARVPEGAGEVAERTIPLFFTLYSRVWCGR